MGFVDKSPQGLYRAYFRPFSRTGLAQPPVATLTAELTANPHRCGEQGRFRDLLDRLGRETADPTRSHPTSTPSP
jgi:hypothetical protein